MTMDSDLADLQARYDALQQRFLEERAAWIVLIAGAYDRVSTYTRGGLICRQPGRDKWTAIAFPSHLIPGSPDHV